MHSAAVVQEAHTMPGTIGAGSLLNPWMGVWDLVWQSPETWPVTTSAVIGLTLAGAALTVIGHRGRGQQAEAGTPAEVVVGDEQPVRPSRRSRRRAA
jgi:hypothetical protein